MGTKRQAYSKQGLRTRFDVLSRALVRRALPNAQKTERRAPWERAQISRALPTRTQPSRVPHCMPVLPCAIQAVLMDARWVRRRQLHLQALVGLLRNLMEPGAQKGTPGTIPSALTRYKDHGAVRIAAAQ